MKCLYVAAGLALAALPANAIAQPQQSKAPAKPAAAKGTKYCFNYDQTVGSRINKSACKTKAEWAREGVDVDKQLGK